MQSFLNKVGKTASEAASRAGNKANELMEVGKLKSKVGSKKQDMGLAKKEIGDYCYDLYTEGKIDDAQIIALCEKIKAYGAEIEELERQIKVCRDDYKAKNGEDFPTVDDM